MLCDRVVVNTLVRAFNGGLRASPERSLEDLETTIYPSASKQRWVCV